MAKKEKRFIVRGVPCTAFGGSTMILVDRETGVNYLYVQFTGGGGLTPLLDQEGKPVITTVFDEE